MMNYYCHRNLLTFTCGKGRVDVSFAMFASFLSIFRTLLLVLLIICISLNGTKGLLKDENVKLFENEFNYLSQK